MSDIELFGSDSEDAIVVTMPRGLHVFKQKLSSRELDSIQSVIRDNGYFNNGNQSMRFGQIPKEFDILTEIAVENLPVELIDRYPLFDQLIANSYDVGEGLVDHVDLDRFCDGIIALSVQGTCEMVFTHLLLPKEVRIFLNPGDVLLFYGSARYDWQHGIPARSHDYANGIKIPRVIRTSITLRKLRLDCEGVNIEC